MFAKTYYVRREMIWCAGRTQMLLGLWLKRFWEIYVFIKPLRRGVRIESAESRECLGKFDFIVGLRVMRVYLEINWKCYVFSDLNI